MVQKAISVKTMMKFRSLLIFVITILAAASNISFGMKAPDQIIIQCKENQKINLDNIKRTNDNPGLGDILQTSQIIKNMLVSDGKKEELKNGSELTIDSISVTQISVENFGFAFKYMSLIAGNKSGEINKELQESGLSDLCAGLSGCNFLNVQFKQQETKSVEHSFVNKRLMPAIVNKFDYKNNNHYECVANKLNELPDHKGIIEQHIIDRLSIGSIPLSVCLYQNNKYDAKAMQGQAFRKPLADLQDTFKPGNLNQDKFDTISAAAEKGFWHVLGYKDGKVVRVCISPKFFEGTFANNIPCDVWFWHNRLATYLSCMEQVCEQRQIFKGELIGNFTVDCRLFDGHKVKIESVIFHSTKKFLVTADETVVKLWDFETCSCIRTFERDADGNFDAASIRFNDAGDKIISGSDANNPLSSWEFHDPYEVVKSLNALKAKLGGKNSFFDTVWKSIPDDTISWPQWLWNNKILISVVACALLYYKRNAVLPYLRHLSPF